MESLVTFPDRRKQLGILVSRAACGTARVSKYNHTEYNGNSPSKYIPDRPSTSKELADWMNAMSHSIGTSLIHWVTESQVHWMREDTLEWGCYDTQ